MAEWVNPEGGPWQTAAQRLQSADLSPNQVQVVWIKLANKGPQGNLEEHGRKLQKDTQAVIQNARAKFPNLKIAYLGSRIYGGWSGGGLNPEPYAYESGFVVRWLIQDQIAGNKELNYDAKQGPVKAPVLLWGPYFWGDGLTPRKADGLVWTRDDLSGDGTHPSDSGRKKVAQMLLDFCKNDPLAAGWFRGSTSSAVRGSKKNYPPALRGRRQPAERRVAHRLGRVVDGDDAPRPCQAGRHGEQADQRITLERKQRQRFGRREERPSKPVPQVEPPNGDRADPEASAGQGRRGAQQRTAGAFAPGPDQRQRQDDQVMVPGQRRDQRHGRKRQGPGRLRRRSPSMAKYAGGPATEDRRRGKGDSDLRDAAVGDQRRKRAARRMKQPVPKAGQR
jgi:hypothetical protein